MSESHRQLVYVPAFVKFILREEDLDKVAVEVQPQDGDLLLSTSFQNCREDVDKVLKEKGLMLLTMHDAAFAVIVVDDFGCWR